MSVEPSIGWGVTHLFYRLDRGRLDDAPLAAKALVETVTGFDVDPYQALCFSVLGNRADFGVMALGPDLERLDAFRHALHAAVGPALVPAGGYVSLTELSEYTRTEDDEREALVADGIAGDDLDERLAGFRARMAEYRQHRLHPRLPRRKVLAFYPMSKSRHPDANWFLLSFGERKRLMGGHARVGRRYTGRVLQLITGSVGLDDHEWGVTLLADDPVAIKDIVYEMRFDEVSAAYGEFGPFWVGLVLPPVDLIARLGLS